MNQSLISETVSIHGYGSSVTVGWCRRKTSTHTLRSLLVCSARLNQCSVDKVFLIHFGASCGASLVCVDQMRVYEHFKTIGCDVFFS